MTAKGERWCPWCFLEGEKRGCVDSGMRDIEVLVTNESELECSRLEFYPFRGAF